MSEWIDITHTLHPGMAHWPGELGFERRVISEIDGPNTCYLSELHTTAHIGTHVDAPCHFIPGAADIASLPLERLCGPATVVEFKAQRDVTADDLAGAGIPAGDRVLIKTVNGGSWPKPGFDEDFVALAGDAARWLVERGTSLVGIDYLSVDGFHTEDKVAHYALLGAGVVCLEGLDLAGVSPGRYELVALPLKIADGDGSPVRAIIRPM